MDVQAIKDRIEQLVETVTTSPTVEAGVKALTEGVAAAVADVRAEIEAFRTKLESGKQIDHGDLKAASDALHEVASAMETKATQFANAVKVNTSASSSTSDTATTEKAPEAPAAGQ